MTRKACYWEQTRWSGEGQTCVHTSERVWEESGSLFLVTVFAEKVQPTSQVCDKVDELLRTIRLCWMGKHWVGLVHRKSHKQAPVLGDHLCWSGEQGVCSDGNQGLEKSCHTRCRQGGSWRSTSWHQSAREETGENKKILNIVMFDSQEYRQDRPQGLKKKKYIHSKD